MQDDLNLLRNSKDNEVGARGVEPEGRRKRPKPGERRDQILQALAGMLEQPGGERITTATLAGRLDVSEAALYRHFASKAQMFEALIDFIEHSIFSLVNQIVVSDTGQDSHAGIHRAKHIVTVLIQFGERNPGMARVMVGDALVLENERLQQRMNQLFDKVESTIKQCLQDPASHVESNTPVVDAQVQASILSAFVSGRLQRYVRTGFRRLPSEQLGLALAQLMG